MKSIEFKALLVSEHENSTYERSIVTRHITDLSKDHVIIKVHYSSLNYKDALSATGNKGVTRNYPHTPGIDAAGIVELSDSTKFKPGDKVIVTGYDLGMNTSGGFGEYISVPADWVVPCPKSLSLKESMFYGTAGFTAALSVYKLLQAGIQPEQGEILVTGATGGVGSIAISLLNKLGYRVVASTGKLQEKEILQRIGAQEVIDRNELDDSSGRPILKTIWAGVIDTVGGNTLTTALKTTKYGGCVTCCGNISSDNFTSSIYPFILRGISLIGIDSVQCPMAIRKDLWLNLSSSWYIDLWPTITQVTLAQLEERMLLMLSNKHVGRTILKHNFS